MAMTRPSLLKTTVAAGLLSLAALPSGSQARASDDCEPACCYVSVTVYIPREVAYTRVVTVYDHCGNPYQVQKTCYKIIQVPVTKRVLVCN